MSDEETIAVPKKATEAMPPLEHGRRVMTFRVCVGDGRSCCFCTTPFCPAEERRIAKNGWPGWRRELAQQRLESMKTQKEQLHD